MALSSLQIKNMALAEVPADRIETEEEASVAADACADNYQPSLDVLIEDYDWDFAIVRATLAEITNDRAAEWAHAYRAPSDMARPLYVLPYAADDPALGLYSVSGKHRAFESIMPFRIAGQTLYTNRDKAVIEYVSNAPSPALFPAKFARALALELASRIVMPIKKDRIRQGDLIKAAEVARERAKAADMNRDRESTHDFIPDEQLARMGILPWQM